MNQTTFFLADTAVHRLSRAEAPSEEAIVHFHGFPGRPPRGQEALFAHYPKKSIDLREALHRASGADVYFPNYEGLGDSRGRFTFLGSVTRSIAVARELAGRHKTLHVVGHSWGGLVAYNAHLALDASAGKLVMLAPLLDLESDGWVRKFVATYQKSYPEILGSDAASHEAFSADLGSVLRAHNPASLPAPGPGLRALVYHGTRDTYVALEPARRLAERIGARFALVDDDHGFMGDRAGMLAAVASFLR